MSPAVPVLPGWLAAYAVIPALLLSRVAVTGIWAPVNPSSSGLRRFRAWCGILAANAVWPTVWAWRLVADDFTGGLPAPGSWFRSTTA